MADTFTTLDQLVRLNDANLSPHESTNLLQNAPVLRAMFSEPASNGTQHKYLRTITAPVVGFRAPNAGLDYGAADEELVTLDLKFLDAKSRIDEAIVKGQTGKRPEDVIARRNRQNLAQAFAVSEKQMWYGVGALGNAAGFAGLSDNAGYNGLADARVVDAGGSAANAVTSCWLLCSNENEARVVMGNDGEISIGDTALQEVRDGSSLAYLAFVTPISAWIGFAFGSAYSAARICNIDPADATTKPLTDALLSKAFSRFPAEKKPNIIAATTKAIGTLQRSRTATSDSGKEADWPTSWQGIPIIATDQLVNTEAVVA